VSTLLRLRRVRAYLALAGAFPRWDLLVYTAILVWGLYAEWTVGEAADAVICALLVAPILAGTGLLTLAREGRLDLLLGSGATRLELWSTALLRTVIIPLAGITLSAAWWLPNAAASRLHAGLHALTAGLFTMGLAFAVGLLQPRYLTGVVWCALRVAYLLAPAGRLIYTAMAHPAEGAPLSFGQGIVGLFGFPEILLRSAVAAGPIAVVLALTAAALALSLAAFLRSDFGGHRTA
jgi:hypothetical protein